MPKDISLHLDDRSAMLRDGLYRSLEQAVLHALGERETDRIVVDVGTGRGELLRALTARGVPCLGIDIEQDCVEFASQYAECSLGTADDIREVLAGRKAHVVVCSHVLEHLNAPMNALDAMHRADAPWLVLAVPNMHRCARIVRALRGNRREDHPEHIYGWGHAELEALVRRAGFNPVRWFADRVTVSAFTPRFGRTVASLAQSIEERLLTRLHPTLASSLILLCQRVDTAR